MSQNYGNLLPNYDELIKRSCQWNDLFEKINRTAANENESNSILFEKYILTEDPNMDSEENETIPPSEFEDAFNIDPDFDLQDALNKTRPIVEQRAKTLEKYGVGSLMDSFNMDKITSKVDNWLKNDRNFFPDASHVIDKIEFKKFSYSDDDSLSSVDTAKYIRSSRKRNKRKVTTMTIKRYCYSTRKLNERDRFERFLKNQVHSEPGDTTTCCPITSRVKSRKLNERDRFERFLKNQAHSEPGDTTTCCPITSRVKSLKKTHRRKSHSSNSSASLSPSPRRHFKYPKPRKLFETDSQLITPRKKLQKHSVAKSSMFNQKLSDTTIHSMKSFNEGNKINSTTMSSIEIPTKTQEQQTNEKEDKKLSKLKAESLRINMNKFKNIEDILKEPVENKVVDKKDLEDSNVDSRKSLQEPVKSPIKVSNPNEKKDHLPILLYDPNKYSIFHKSIIDGKLTITEDLLIQSIGENLTKEYLNGYKEFAGVFNATSKVYFHPPEYLETSSDSSDSEEQDILSKSCHKIKAKIVELLGNSQT